MSVLNNSRTEALEKAFGDSDKAEVQYCHLGVPGYFSYGRGLVLITVLTLFKPACSLVKLKKSLARRKMSEFAICHPYVSSSDVISTPNGMLWRTR